jgi:hypothetical protein
VSEREDDVRVSDGERDAAAAALCAHWEAGRLALPELEQRVDAVYLATTRAELDRQLRDLPERRGDQPAGPALRRRRRLFLPGRTGGTRIVAVGEAPRAVRKAFAELRD